MEKYNKFLRNIAELIEKGLFTSKDLKKEVENVVKFNIDNVRNRLDLVSREEFEIQKKIIENLQRKLTKPRGIKGKKKFNNKSSRVTKS